MELDNVQMRHVVCRCCGHKGHYWKFCNCGHLQCKRKPKSTFIKSKAKFKPSINNVETNNGDDSPESESDSSESASDDPGPELNNVLPVCSHNNECQSSSLLKLNDCGATHNFIVGDIVKKCSILSKPLSKTMSVSGAGQNSLLGHISSKTNQISLKIGKYCESESFYVLPNLKHDIILGLP
ncbi:hypothetical protein O9G_006122 [Rozella allomycis CSF55]|uniref:Uncharacterized protein n=1 Tax=Rozella allomycis (strain CSF55) TaxID=988480 RepID=A0A075AQW9_ROZAC|nr:hypothetical protein O9G_006122 [Rozella allomycis CSF55]|eukprot:EPZ32681.1 hypothetical protein O9G_006122 [Rozella allomycis CSF55]